MAGNLEAVTAGPIAMSASSHSAPATPAAPNDASGKNVAPAGQRLPPKAPPPATADVAEVVRRLNELTAARQRNLSFHVDEASGRTVITVRDARTAQVVRQIPAEEVLSFARVFEDPGVLVDARI